MASKNDCASGVRHGDLRDTDDIKAISGLGINKLATLNCHRRDSLHYIEQEGKTL
jgi:hypothetical protein